VLAHRADVGDRKVSVGLLHNRSDCLDVAMRVARRVQDEGHRGMEVLKPKQESGSNGQSKREQHNIDV
jgi:hypothetical protein